MATTVGTGPNQIQELHPGLHVGDADLSLGLSSTALLGALGEGWIESRAARA